MKSIKKSNKLLLKIILGISLILMSNTTNAKAAEIVTLINGSFSRSINYEDFEKLAKTKRADGVLYEIIKISNQGEKEVADFLNEEHELPIVLTSRLLNSRIGEVLLARIAKIIHPIRVTKSSVAVPAIRSAIIKGVYLGEGNLTMLNFIKAYPNQTMAINTPALMSVIDKVESISEVVNFFSKSPLEALKKVEPNKIK